MEIVYDGYKRIVHIDGKTVTFGESASEQHIRIMAPIIARKMKNKKVTT